MTASWMLEAAQHRQQYGQRTAKANSPARAKGTKFRRRLELNLCFCGSNSFPSNLARYLLYRNRTVEWAGRLPVAPAVTDGDCSLPTTLPHRRRAHARRSPARLAFDVLFNGAMLASALILAFIVLEREEQYASDQQDIANQTLLMRAAEPATEAELIPPLD